MKLSILIKLSSSGFNEREVAWVENLSISDFRYWASNLCWYIVILRLSLVFHCRSTEVLFEVFLQVWFEVLLHQLRSFLRCSSRLSMKSSAYSSVSSREIPLLPEISSENSSQNCNQSKIIIWLKFHHNRSKAEGQFQSNVWSLTPLIYDGLKNMQ